MYEICYKNIWNIYLEIEGVIAFKLHIHHTLIYDTALYYVCNVYMNIT